MSNEDTSRGPVKLQVMPDGPLRVTGDVSIVDKDGAVLFEGESTALCRCGLSANKPFCDGTHRKDAWKENG